MERNHISWDILLRKVRRTLPPEEEAVFQEWLAGDERHREYYERVRRVWSAEETTCEMDTDIARVIAGFDDYVRKERELRRKRMVRHAYRYAACLFFLLVVGGGILFLNKGEKQAERLASVNKESVPGGNKAIILLGDGKKVDVEMLADTMFYKAEGIEVQKNAGVIKYSGLQKSEVTYNTIMIPRGGEYQVELSDGTMVWLNSETQLKVPTAFVGEERRVFLLGEAYFAVTKDDRKPFIVETDLGNVKVYGTEFNVKRYRDEKQLKATLVEGVIGFSSDRIGELKLKPGYQLSLTEGAGKPEIKQVKIYNEIAWRNKQFCFENETLEEIARELERWYNVKIVFADPVLKDLVFSGTLSRYGKIETLLRLFEEGVEVKFVVEKDTVKVMRK
ncbi:FecR family protein [Butyricimonas synergistica]|uniref:FecR family protein n=1 Tax=Butyricimonas synergistica TaxID=544644 RepID=UPI0003656F50|nr:FecR domain-containing protein [Butyricimonas synergistica]